MVNKTANSLLHLKHYTAVWKNAPASTLQKNNVFSAMLQNISVFSATIKVRQILPEVRNLLKNPLLEQC